ncbi:hypothetical protein L1049_011999 [Liquidambar formosana]|uniref:R13L1/DRL21-like LRR repeat region domain-containing protein n=1 Tax=Liquidambar formosana TaxID=63359 RepID=A0AAP0WXE7_LIQFO
MPSGLVHLTSLQTLPRFIVGENFSNSKLIGGPSVLNSLNFLRGELRIEHLEHVKNATSESKEANMKGKQYLQALRLYWYREDDDGGDADDALLEGLQPHQNLKELHLCGYGCVRFSSWLMASMVTLLPNLVKITFESCVRCQHLPPFGQLPFLKVLELYILTALEYIDDDNTSPSSSNSASEARGCLFFPSLKELKLYELPLLKEWPREVVIVNNYGSTTAIAALQQQQEVSLLSFPCLTTLNIKDCPSLTSMPLLPNLEELMIENVTEKLLQSLMMVAATNSSTTSSSLARLKSLRISSCPGPRISKGFGMVFCIPSFGVFGRKEIE